MAENQNERAQTAKESADAAQQAYDVIEETATREDVPADLREKAKKARGGVGLWTSVNKRFPNTKYWGK